MSSEVYSYLFEKILKEGALDIYIQNIQMKKNRPAHKINLIVKEEDLDKFIEILLVETSTLGVRYNKFNRAKLKRRFVDLDTDFGIVKIKLGYYNNKLIKAKPEYDECKNIAFDLNIPIKQVYDAINTNINQKISENLLT